MSMQNDNGGNSNPQYQVQLLQGLDQQMRRMPMDWNQIQRMQHQAAGQRVNQTTTMHQTAPQHMQYGSVANVHAGPQTPQIIMQSGGFVYDKDTVQWMQNSGMSVPIAATAAVPRPGQPVFGFGFLSPSGIPVAMMPQQPTTGQQLTPPYAQQQMQMQQMQHVAQQAAQQAAKQAGAYTQQDPQSSQGASASAEALFPYKARSSAGMTEVMQKRKKGSGMRVDIPQLIETPHQYELDNMLQRQKDASDRLTMDGSNRSAGGQNSPGGLKTASTVSSQPQSGGLSGGLTNHEPSSANTPTFQLWKSGQSTAESVDGSAEPTPTAVASDDGMNPQSNSSEPNVNCKSTPQAGMASPWALRWINNANNATTRAMQPTSAGETASNADVAEDDSATDAEANIPIIRIQKRSVQQMESGPSSGPERKLQKTSNTTTGQDKGKGRADSMTVTSSSSMDRGENSISKRQASSYYDNLEPVPAIALPNKGSLGKTVSDSEDLNKYTGLDLIMATEPHLICDHLDIGTLVQCSRVNRLWFRAVNNLTIWQSLARDIGMKGPNRNARSIKTWMSAVLRKRKRLCHVCQRKFAEGKAHAPQCHDCANNTEKGFISTREARRMYCLRRNDLQDLKRYRTKNSKQNSVLFSLKEVSSLALELYGPEFSVNMSQEKRARLLANRRLDETVNRIHARSVLDNQSPDGTLHTFMQQEMNRGPRKEPPDLYLQGNANSQLRKAWMTMFDDKIKESMDKAIRVQLTDTFRRVLYNLPSWLRQHFREHPEEAQQYFAMSLNRAAPHFPQQALPNIYDLLAEAANNSQLQQDSTSGSDEASQRDVTREPTSNENGVATSPQRSLSGSDSRQHSAQGAGTTTQADSERSALSGSSGSGSGSGSSRRRGIVDRKNRGSSSDSDDGSGRGSGFSKGSTNKGNEI
eukprot:Clim_evm6s241 gene=Clim_evmTU6s241